MARGLDWKVLVWVGCVACGSGGEDTTLESGATSPSATSDTTTPPASGGSAGMRATGAAAAGKPATPTGGTMTGNTASAGKPAAASGGSGGTTGGSSAAGSSAAGSGGTSANSAGSSGAAGGSTSSAGTSGAAGKAGAGGTSAAAGSGGSTTPRAGSGGTTGGTSGSGAAGAAGGAASAEHEDLGKGDGSDVVLIGDSWMSNTLQIEGTGGGIAPALIAASMQRYTNYGLQGVMLLEPDTFGPAIPTQWDDAKRVNMKIQTVVMSGGGNDIIQGSATLQSSCQMGTDECKQKLVAISDALDKLWTQMAADGVKDVIYIRYTDNTGTLAPELQGDKGLPVPKICLTGKIGCHDVPTTDIVAATDLAADGIHPLASANQRIAMRIMETMEKVGARR